MKKVTEQQKANSDKEKGFGVTLNGRFVQREGIVFPNDCSCFNSDPDRIISCLTAYFELAENPLFVLSTGPSNDLPDANLLKDDMPRFHESIRNGLQVPKEGKDGTGN